jgi:oligo-alginate lyase
MTRLAPVLVTLAVLLVAAAHADPQAVILSAPDQALTGWAKPATPLLDGPGGKPAVMWSVATGGPQSLSFALPKDCPKLAAWDTLAFDYRLLDPGMDWWGLKIVDYPLAEGFQATWQISPDEALPVGQWRHVELDLQHEMFRWADKPDKTSRVIMFRAQVGGKEPVRVAVANLTLLRQPLALGLQSEAKPELQGAQLTKRAVLRVENRTDRPQTLRLRAAGAPAGLTVTFEPPEVAVPAAGQAEVTTRMSLDTSGPGAPAPLSETVCKIAAGTGADAVTLDLRLPVPLGQAKHPCLLVTEAEIPGLLAKVNQLPAWKARFDALKGACDAWLNQTPTYPDRGSQWWHWYTCKKCGASLKTKSPTEHVCPDCGAVYTGWPYDDVVLAGQHGRLAGAIRDLGLMYALTKNPAYAAKCREILLGYADRYLKYPLHDINGKPLKGGGHVGPQSLDEAVWLIPVAQGFDCIYDALSEADRTTIADQLLLPAANLIHDHQWGIHNICCWHDSAYGLVGITLGDARLARDAIEGPKGFRAQIAKGVTDDGLWYENAWGYHFYTMSALTPLAEAARRIGIDLYSPRYKSMYDAPLQFMSGSGELPSFADSHRMNVLVPGNAWLYETAFARWHDPRYTEILKADKRRSLEAFLVGADEKTLADSNLSLTSHVFAAAGFAMLRSSSAGNTNKALPDNYVAIHYGPHGGGHGHPDKLSFVFYGHNQLLGTDPGCIAYGNPAHPEYYRQTLSHNTILVDHKSQRECTGTLICSALADNAGFVTCAADKAYSGVRFQRTIALIGDELLDLVVAESAEEHCYELAYHSLGTLDTDLARTPATDMPADKAFARVTDWQLAQPVAPWQAIWRTDKVSARLVQATVSPGQVFTGIGMDNPTSVKAPLILSRQTGKTAIWATAISLFTGAAAPATQVQVKALNAPRAYALTATTGAQRDLLLVNPDGGEVAWEGYKLRGQGALLRIVAGKVNLITLSGGAAVTSGGQPVTASP